MIKRLIRQSVSISVLLIVVASCLWAVSAVKKTSSHTSGPPEFSGTVYLPNGQPARNVTLLGYRVMMQGNGMNGRPLDKVTTDSQGRYQLRIPSNQSDKERANATYIFLLYSPDGLGYVQVGQPWRGVTPRSPLNLHLQQGDQVTGRVIGYPGGQPLAGIQVSAEIHPPGTRHVGQVAEKATTDHNGRFRLNTSLPPRQYSVEARPARWAILQEMMNYQRPSETASIRTIEIKLVRPYTIQGHAYGSDGKPLSKRKIELFRYLTVTTDAAGAYAFSQKPQYTPYGGGPYLGRYQPLVPKLSGAVARPVLVDATDPATQTVDLHFSSPAKIMGRQVDARTGKPAVGVRVTVIPVGPGALSQVWSGLQEGVFDKEHSTIKDDETGRFVLRGVPPGEYWLQFESWTIQELTAENGKAARVTVRPGQTLDVGTTQLKYVPYLRGQYSGLTWKPDPENSMEEMHGMLRPSGSKDPGKEGYFDLWAGPGKYTLWATGLSSGTYDAVLVTSHNNRRYVTQVLHNMALTDDVPQEGVNLRFTRGASIRGSMVQAKGKPLPETPISVRAVGGDALLFNAQSVYGERFGQVMISLGTWTDKKGNFVLDGLLSGTYELTTMAEPIENGPPQTLRVQVGATEQKRGVVLRTKL